MSRFPLRWVLGLVGLLFGAGGLLILRQINAAHDQQVRNPKRDSLNIGTVSMQRDFSWRLPITNSTAHAIDVIGFETSCSCTNVSPKSFTLGPGQVQEIQLKIDLLKANPEEIGLPFRPFEVEVIPRTASGVLPPRLVKGTVKSGWKLVTTTLFFDEWLAGSKPKSMSSEIRPNFELTEIVATPQVGICSAEVHKTRSGFVVDVVPETDIKPGDYTLPIELLGREKGGEVVGGPPVIVKFRVIGTIEAWPADIVLGARKLGSEAVDTVTLRSRAGVTFDLLHVESEGNNLDVTEEPTAIGNSEHILRIVQKVQEPGNQSTVVRCIVKLQGAQESEVLFKVSYIGVLP
jgi:hypothetical protein